jgi:hypothetical protein
MARRQILMHGQRDRPETPGYIGRSGMSQHRHRGLAPRLPTIFETFVTHHQISLAGIKLSMILDNLITKRHDDFVTLR